MTPHRWLIPYRCRTWHAFPVLADSGPVSSLCNRKESHTRTVLAHGYKGSPGVPAAGRSQGRRAPLCAACWAFLWEEMVRARHGPCQPAGKKTPK